MKVSYLPRTIKMYDSNANIVMLESRIEELQLKNIQLTLEIEKLHKIIETLLAKHS